MAQLAIIVTQYLFILLNTVQQVTTCFTNDTLMSSGCNDFKLFKGRESEYKYETPLKTCFM